MFCASVYGIYVELFRCLWDLCVVILIGDRFSLTELSPIVSEMQIAEPIGRSIDTAR